MNAELIAKLEDHEFESLPEAREMLGIEFEIGNGSVIPSRDTQFSFPIVCKLNGQTLEITYSMGIGHGVLRAAHMNRQGIVYPQSKWYGKGLRRKFDFSKDRGMHRQWNNVRTPEDIENFCQHHRRYTSVKFEVNSPEPDSLFYAIMSDARTALDYSDHYEMCEEFGYTPSRKTEVMYAACKETLEFFVHGAGGWGNAERLLYHGFDY